MLLAGLAGIAGYAFSRPISAAAPPAELVIYGRIWTGDSLQPWAQAIAVSGEKIAAVGDSAAVAKLVGRAPG